MPEQCDARDHSSHDDGGKPPYAAAAAATVDAAAGGREWLDMLFEHAQDAILLADDSGNYVEVNPAACALTGLTRDALLRSSVFDITPVPDRATGERLWREFISAGKQGGEYPLCRADGASVTIEDRAVANIQPGLHLSILRDIGDRKQAEIERQRSLRQTRVFDTILTSISDCTSSTTTAGSSTPTRR